MKNRSIKIEKDTNTKYKYLLPVFVVSIFILGGVVYQNQQSTSTRGKTVYHQTVLGEESEASGEREKTEKIEIPKPTEAPESEEPTEANEQEAKDIQDEIENEVEQGKVEEIEVEPTSEKQGEGTLRVERVNGTTSEKNVPISSTPLVQFQNAQVGTVAISIGKDGTITLVNNNISVTTNYPVVIDPQSQTIAVRTTNGVTLINTLPSQALNGIKPTDKPSTIDSAVLGVQNKQTYYAVKGTQIRKFIGLVPIKANVETKVSTENGSVISVDRPWYLNLLGFLYTT